jgi:chemotaxis protein MotB
MKTLTDSYSALEKNSDEALKANMQKNRELLAQLDSKEKALAAEQNRLNKLQSDLKERSQRVTDLENMISAKEESMRKLKETLSKALNSFEGKGLTVEQKNGKVYVSMENKLLFQTGSWAVGTEGKRAVVEVGKVLAQNPDITVLIEGHTDNDKILGSIGGGIENNWDLSTKRATAIVNILAENKGIDKKNLTAAGRGEFAPLMPNETAEGKAKNRRIEIILTPKLDEISKMLNDL